MAKIVLLGPPGSGKGTQAEMISERYGWPQISTGNILRHAIEERTETGFEAKTYMDRGELVPDEVVDRIVAERLKKPDCADGYVLDGFPRDLEQAHALDGISKVDAVFDISVPDDELVERLSQRRVCDCGQTYHLKHNPPRDEGVCDECGKKLLQRKDDSEETIRHRLHIYHSETEPLIDYYKNREILVVVDGTKDIEDVYSDIVDDLP